MGRRDGYAPGLFCWVDLATTDTAAAAGFYGNLLGWTTQDLPGDYTIFQHEGATAAGMIRLQPGAGTAPYWASYVTVEDVEAAAARAQELGGALAGPTIDIEGTGRRAIVTDPQGALLSLWQPGPFFGAEVVNEPGAFTWNDLQTTVSPEEAAPFYRELFGWTIAETPGSGGRYHTIMNGDRANGGIMASPVPGAPAYWNAYFAVADLDASLEHVRAGGGHVLAGPMAVGEDGRFAACQDPQGAVFSLFAGRFDE